MPALPGFETADYSHSWIKPHYLQRGSKKPPAQQLAYKVFEYFIRWTNFFNFLG